MKKLIKIFLSSYVTLSGFVLNAQTPDFRWLSHLSGTAVVSGALGNYVDSYGNVFTTGSFSGTVDFDPGPGIQSLASSGPGTDIFISKMSPQGNLIWVKQIGGSAGADEGVCIVKDSYQNIYVSGRFYGVADLDPGPATYTLAASSATWAERFICKLDSTGNFLWVKQFGRYYMTGPVGSLIIDNGGNILFDGHFSGTVDFDPGPGVSNLNSFGSNDIFIASLNSSGALNWVRQFGGAGNEINPVLALSPLGEVFLAANFNGTVDVDPGPSSYTLASMGAMDVFICKLTSSGNFIWAKSTGGSANEAVTSITSDMHGNVLFTGSFDSPFVDFDPGPSTSTLQATGNSWGNGYICKLNLAGQFIWAKQFGTHVWRLSLDASGSIFTAGMFNGGTDFDPGAGTYSLTAIGTLDLFVHKMDSAGNFVFALPVGGNSNAVYPRRMSLDGAGAIYVSGEFQGNVDFDPGIVVYNASSSGTWQGYTLKLSLCENIPVLIGSPLFCFGDTLKLQVNGANINWFSSPSSTLAFGSGNTFTLTPPPAGSYTYFAQASTCTLSGTRLPVKVLVNSNPSVNIITSQTVICYGAVIQLTASGAHSYSWNASAQTGTIYAASPVGLTTYSLTGKDTLTGCSNTATLNLNTTSCVDLPTYQALDLFVGPNPFNEKLFIDCKTDKEITIYDAQGKIVFQNKISSGSNQINNLNFPPGVYFLQVSPKSDNRWLKLIKE